MAALATTGSLHLRQPRLFTAGARPQHAWVICQARRHDSECSSGAAAAPEQQASRRGALLAGVAALAAVPALLSPAAALAAENEAVTRGLNLYIKRKKYDAIETYLPPLIAARGQLIRSGYLVAQDPTAARQMLREGAFAGLRDNVRAVGDYATQQGKAEEGPAAVNGFFKALEAYDYQLLQGSRNKEGVNVEVSKEKLNEAVTALDKLLALLPTTMVSKAEDIVAEIEAELQSERETLQAERELQLQQEAERLDKLL